MSNFYSGIYGTGEQDSQGNLYLGLKKDLTLVREVNVDGTYDVSIINEMEQNGLSLLENITLKEWKEFF